MRKIVIEVLNKLTVSKLSIKFKIKKNREGKNNKAEIEIINLKEYNLLEYNDIVYIRAGNVDQETAESQETELPIIFIGNLISFKEEGVVDKVTKMSMQEGTDLIQSHVFIKFPKSTTLNDNLKLVLDKINLNFNSIDFNRNYSTSFILYGTISEIITELLEGTGYQWKVDNNIVIIYKNDPPKTALELSSGFIELPKFSTENDTQTNHSKTLLFFKIPLDPRLSLPFVKLNYKDFKNVYTIDKIIHIGANRLDQNWSTEVLCLT